MKKLDATIERFVRNAEYERTHGSLQGCMDFKQLAEWLKDYKRLLEQEPKTDVLGKISAEIEDLVYPNGCSDYLLGFNFGLMRAAQVINKYKAETE